MIFRAQTYIQVVVHVNVQKQIHLINTSMYPSREAKVCTEHTLHNQK